MDQLAAHIFTHFSSLVHINRAEKIDSFSSKAWRRMIKNAVFRGFVQFAR